MKVAFRDVNYQFWANAYTTLISFALFALLAHFLKPPEFGLYALGTVVSTVVYSLGQAGFVNISYSQIGRGEGMRNTLFWANVITACTFVIIADTVIYIVISEPGERVFIICIISMLLITSIAEVANVSLLTAHRFRALAAKQFTVQTVGAAAAIFAAFAGMGAWSLLVQRCVIGLLEIVLVFSLLRWLPRFWFDLAEFRRLLPTAIGFAGSASLGIVDTRLADLVIAGISTLDQVATYRIASRVFEAIMSLIQLPIGSVANASVAAAEFANKGAVYIAHVRLFLWVGSIPFASLLCFGDIAVPLVFGKTWSESGVIAQILAVQFFVAAPTWLMDSALIGAGHPRDLVKLRSLSAIISAPLFIVFGMFGIKYIALVFSIRAAILLVPCLKATRFLTALSNYQAIKITVIPYLVSIFSACVARTVFDYIRLITAGAVPSLVIGVLVGGLVFLVLFWKFGRSELRSIYAWKYS